MMKELCSNCRRPAKGRWLLLEPEGWTYYRNDVEVDQPSPWWFCSLACAREAGRVTCQKGHTVVQIDDD